MAKKLVALLLVLMLTMGGSVLATAEAASTDTATQTDSIFPLKDEITLTAFVLGMPGGVDYTNNYVTQWIKEKTNINLQFVAAVSGDDGKTGGKKSRDDAGRDQPHHRADGEAQGTAAN